MAQVVDIADRRAAVQGPGRLARAYDLAARAHQGMTYGPARIPYVTHPIAVARLVSDHGGREDAVIAAVLHDVVERAGVPLAEVRDAFGAEVAALVEALTNLPEWDGLPTVRKKTRQAERIAAAPDAARLVKLADQCMNLADYASGAETGRRGKVRRYLKGARRVAAACAGVAPALDALFAEVADRLAAKLKEDRR